MALPPPSVHEIRLESDMFVARINFDFRIAHCEPRYSPMLLFVCFQQWVILSLICMSKCGHSLYFVCMFTNSWPSLHLSICSLSYFSFSFFFIDYLHPFFPSLLCFLFCFSISVLFLTSSQTTLHPLLSHWRSTVTWHLYCLQCCRVSELLDYSAEELTGKNLYTLCHGEDANKLRKSHVDCK
jgi:hypothetical protein